MGITGTLCITQLLIRKGRACVCVR